MKVLLILSPFLFLMCSKNTLRVNSVANDSIYLQEKEVHLASPIIHVDSLLFRESAIVSIDLGIQDADIFYRINKGDDGTYSMYNGTIELFESSTLISYVTKDGYLKSDVTKVEIVKIPNITEKAKISITPTANENYPGGGATSLLDLKKGSLNFRNGNEWSGFQEKAIIINIELIEATELSRIYLSTLSDHGAWIFLPEGIKVYIDDELKVDQYYGLPHSMSKSELNMIRINLDKSIGRQIRIEIENIDAIPEWHAGKGTPPWFFIDEIIVE